MQKRQRSIFRVTEWRRLTILSSFLCLNAFFMQKRKKKKEINNSCLRMRTVCSAAYGLIKNCYFPFLLQFFHWTVNMPEVFVFFFFIFNSVEIPCQLAIASVLKRKCIRCLIIYSFMQRAYFSLLPHRISLKRVNWKGHIILFLRLCSRKVVFLFLYIRFEPNLITRTEIHIK